jgi:gliding motility-associated-like protein
MNALNGCTAIATNTINPNVTPPGTVALAPITLPCGQTTTVITAGTTTTSSTYSYTWKGPLLAGMSCPGGPACYSTQVNMPGTYYVSITNTVNGCSSTNSVVVNAGTVSASFDTDPDFGFAPLTVNFNNTSNLGSLTSGTVSTTWNYGNGMTYTASGSSPSYSTTGYPDGLAVYQSAGSYTVWMIITQNTGTASCIGTASAVVTVDLPSDLTVPNVFTPNGDGVNDEFTLLTTNLTNITCVIFDRWGVKVYDVTSEKGNISWDGKNFSNKDVPAGTYFYILKAKGKDMKDFELKGPISLFR